MATCTGRGTVDMKGGVACMLMAVEILKELGVPLARRRRLHHRRG